jgi:hypothetical protein
MHRLWIVFVLEIVQQGDYITVSEDDDCYICGRTKDRGFMGWFCD